jgi:hypothetical protein
VFQRERFAPLAPPRHLRLARGNDHPRSAASPVVSGWLRLPVPYAVPQRALIWACRRVDKDHEAVAIGVHGAPGGEGCHTEMDGGCLVGGWYAANPIQIGHRPCLKWASPPMAWSRTARVRL